MTDAQKWLDDYRATLTPEQKDPDLFLEKLYKDALLEGGRKASHEQAINIYRGFGPFHFGSDHEGCAKILNAIDLDRVTLIQILALLTAILPWKHTKKGGVTHEGLLAAIEAREELARRATAKVKEDHPDRWKRLLAGLV